MKKFTLSALAALMMSVSVSAQGSVTTTYVKASDKNAINSAINAAIGAGNTHIVVLCKSLSEGVEGEVADATTTASLGTKPKVPAAGTLIIRSNQTDIDNLPELTLEMGANAIDASVGLPSLVFENVKLRPRKDTDSYIVSNKNKDNFYGMDSVVFRNCDISNCRAIYREENQGTNGVFTPHHIKRFIFEGNRAYETVLKDNSMPRFYFVAIPDYLEMHNNIFYDMPYSKELIGFHKTAKSENTASTFHIYNNTFLLSSWSSKGTKNKFTVVNAGTNVDPNSIFNFYNNLFLAQEKGLKVGGLEATPVAIADSAMTLVCNTTSEEEGVTVTNPAGFLTTYNNYYSTYYLSPVRKGMEAFDVCEDLNIADYPFSFDMFYDADKSLYTVEKGNSAGLFTAGANAVLDMNNNPAFAIPTCVGAPMMYVDEFPVKVDVKVTINGSNSATYTITPEKAEYYKGDEVTITLNARNSYYRTFNTFTGWSDGNTDLERSIVLGADGLDLTANFESAMTNVAAAWDFSSNPSSNSKVSSVLAEYGVLAGVATIKAFVADTTGIGNVATTYTTTTEDVEAGKADASGTKLSQAYNAATGNYEILGVAYSKRATEAVPYVAGSFETRSNKFGEDETEKQMAIISMRTPRNTRDYNRNYAVIELPAAKLSNIQVDYFIGTDNNASKNQKLYYSLDGENYTEIADAAVELTNGQWSNVQATLPAACNNAEKVYIKIQGQINNGDTAENIVYTPQTSSFNPEKIFDNDVFEYIGNILITADGATGVVVTEADAAEAAAAPVKVIENGGIVIIKDGKKFTAAGAQVK